MKYSIAALLVSGSLLTASGAVAAPSDLSTLLPCQAGANCTDDVFQRVWARIVSVTGETTKIDMHSIQHADNGTAWVVIYTYVPGTMFDPNKMRRLIFDCHGQYQDIGSGSSLLFDAPPGSVIGKVSAIACAGASDTRLKSADRNFGPPPDPAAYCNGFSKEACDRIARIGKTGVSPSYCVPGFGRAGSGLSPEQVRTCDVARAYASMH